MLWKDLKKIFVNTPGNKTINFSNYTNSVPFVQTAHIYVKQGFNICDLMR